MTAYQNLLLLTIVLLLVTVSMTLWTPMDSLVLVAGSSLAVLLVGVALIVEVKQRRQREAEEKYRSLVEAALVGVYLIQDMRIQYANPKLCEILQYAPDELDQMGLESLLILEDYHKVKVSYQKRLAQSNKGEVYRYKAIRKDGTLIDIEGTSSLITYRGKPALIGTLQDNSLRTLNEQLNQRLTTIVEVTSDLISIADTKGEINYLNESARRALGLGEDNNYKDLHIAQFYPEWVNTKLVREGFPTAEKEGIWKGEIVIVTLDGHSFPASQAIYAHMDACGKVRYYSMVARDLTEQKEKEEAWLSRKVLHQAMRAQEAERKRWSKELHDGVGQSLYSLLLGIQVLESEPRMEPELLKYVQGLQKELHHVMDVIKMFSRDLRPYILDELGLIAALEHLVNYANKGNESITITFIYDGQTKGRLNSEIEIQIYRIAQEALLNSIKHAQSQMIEVRFTQKPDGILLMVKDYGIGFDPSSVNAGLGLRHMEERAKQIRGKLIVYARSNLGTIVSLVLQENLEVYKHDYSAFG